MPNRYAGRNHHWHQMNVSPDSAREIAIGAVRSYLRSMGIEPLETSVEGAVDALDDLIRADKNTIAAGFAQYASITQLKKFQRDWRAYLKHNGFYVKTGGIDPTRENDPYRTER